MVNMSETVPEVLNTEDELRIAQFKVSNPEIEPEPDFDPGDEAGVIEELLDYELDLEGETDGAEA